MRAAIISPIIMTTITTMAESALFRLMTWLSPSYPVGAFSYSHGLEYAVEIGAISDGASLGEWVATALAAGAGRSDAALFAAAYRAACAGDAAALDEIAALAAAWRGTAETALESAAQGAAFLATTRAAWPHPALEAFALRHDGPTGSGVALPVAVAVAAAAHAIELAPSLTAYLHAFASNLVSAGIRLIPLGQTEGQRCLAALAAPVAQAVERALATPLEGVGTAAPVLDWCSMRHETQYTRLFRS